MNISSTAFMRPDCTYWMSPTTPYQLPSDTWKCKYRMKICSMGTSHLNVLHIDFQNVLRWQVVQIPHPRTVRLLRWRCNISDIFLVRCVHIGRHHYRCNRCQCIGLTAHSTHSSRQIIQCLQPITQFNFNFNFYNVNTYHNIVYFFYKYRISSKIK